MYEHLYSFIALLKLKQQIKVWLTLNLIKTVDAPSMFLIISYTNLFIVLKLWLKIIFMTIKNRFYIISCTGIVVSQMDPFAILILVVIRYCLMLIIYICSRN